VNDTSLHTKITLYKNPHCCRQFAKIFSTIFLTTAIGFGWLWFYQIPQVKHAVFNERIQEAHNLVDVSGSLITSYYDRAKTGSLSKAEAQKRALSAIRQIRYSNGQYIWVHDLTPTMIMHPTLPNLEGTNLATFSDATGRKIFLEMNALVQQKREGIIKYLWPRPEGGKPEEKMSWISLYRPWGWVVGSGIYLEDLTRDFSHIKNRLLLSGISAFVIMLAITMYLVYRINKPVLVAQEVARRIVAGEAWHELKIDENTEAGNIVGVMRALTEDLKNAKDQAAAILHAAGDGIIGLDQFGAITFANHSAEQLSGWLTRDMLGNNIHHLFHHSDKNNEVLTDEICPILRCCNNGLSTEISGELFRRKDGSIFPVNYLVTPFKGGQHGAVLVFRDITERQKLEQRVIWLAHHDPLTGLLNRNAFEEHLACLDAICRREQRRIAILYIDLDGFKLVNDQFGHDAGDAVLCAVSERLKKIMREVDVLARFGGDEFVAAMQIMPDQNNAANQVSTRLLEALCTPVPYAEHHLSVGVSIGIACYDPCHDSNIDLTIRRADQALYQAKREGKNRVVCDAANC
jgi:diguanylate cyclase (GGDEF)-like protein/PAS domain S-box-containing protein